MKKQVTIAIISFLAINTLFIVFASTLLNRLDTVVYVGWGVFLAQSIATILLFQKKMRGAGFVGAAFVAILLLMQIIGPLIVS